MSSRSSALLPFTSLSSRYTVVRPTFIDQTLALTRLEPTGHTMTSPVS
ncbi:MAG: hypothetical protein RLZZ217_2221, partial [Planctomycetota bacterium]